MDNVTTVGIDLAKNVFSVHGVDAGGAVRVRKTVSRGKLMEWAYNWARAGIALLTTGRLETCSQTFLLQTRTQRPEEELPSTSKVENQLALRGKSLEFRSATARRRISTRARMT